MSYYEGASNKKTASLRNPASMVQRCSVCGRSGSGLSIDGGKTLLCADHVPPDFWPHARRKGVSPPASDEF